MMGRTTDLVFTLVADDFIMMCHPCQMGMTSKAGDTACSPITECDAGMAPDPNKRIFTTRDALLTSVAPKSMFKSAAQTLPVKPNKQLGSSNCMMVAHSAAVYPAARWVAATGSGTGMSATLTTGATANEFVSITFTSGVGYVVGDVITMTVVHANSATGVSGCSTVGFSYTIRASDLDSSDGLEGTIIATTDKYISSSSITTSGKGSSLSLRYSSTTTKITSITVGSSGFGYVTQIDQGSERERLTKGGV